MRSREYADDVLAAGRPVRRAPEVVGAERGLVVEERSTGFCGAVVDCDKERVSLEDRHGKVRVFPFEPGGFLLDGVAVTLERPRAVTPAGPRRTASGSVAVVGQRARVAAGSRIWVEGRHDAELVERVWGDDLRVEGVVVEALDGVDDLAAEVRAFAPTRDRRLGVLVDHLVAGSKESRVVAEVTHPQVLVTGHPYVDVWQAVKPARLGITAWPEIPRGTPWKEGVCAALGWGEPWEGWKRVLAAVDGWTDLEVPLLQSVERLIDFVTEPREESG
ncbi:MAG: DUF3097 domain-containing protein [Mycobacteriales bacterium]|nr:DUF3097 domain-containing protein [Mycobacteriales bacterium]